MRVKVADEPLRDGEGADGNFSGYIARVFLCPSLVETSLSDQTTGKRMFAPIA